MFYLQCYKSYKDNLCESLFYTLSDFVLWVLEPEVLL